MSGDTDPMLAFVAAMLDRFGPTMRLHYRAPSGERCVMVFPQPEAKEPESGEEAA